MHCHSHALIAAIGTMSCCATGWSDLLFAEEFNGNQIPAGWTLSFAGNTAGWNGAVGNGTLTVTEITPTSFPPGCDTSGAAWSDVNLDHDIAPAGDFALDALISWDSAGVNSAMQSVLISVLDCHGNLLGQVGMTDAWVASNGAKTAVLGGQFAFTGAGSVPGAATSTIQLARSGNTWTATVGGTVVLTKTVIGVPRTLRLTFAYYAAHACAGGNTVFGTESVDLITLQGDAHPQNLADLNGDGQVDGADLGMLLALWGSNDCMADIDHNGNVDGADLGSLLGAWTA